MMRQAGTPEAGLAPIQEIAAAKKYPITRHGGGEEIVARRGDRAITRAEFLRDSAALASRLPAQKYVINLCTDRYHFMVGFAAALCRGQISLLPPSDAPGVLKAVAADYPDLYALTDTPAELPFPALMLTDMDFDPPATPRHARECGHPRLSFNISAGFDDANSGPLPAIPGTQPALILFTSGSTGRPAPVPKSWGVLVRSALAAGGRLRLAPGTTLIGTVPHQHSYGLESTILLGLQHGLAVAAGGLLYPADIRAAIAAAPRPRVLVTTPVHLQALMAEPEDLPAADLILSATAPLAAELARQAETRFNTKLIEIYGCTEAGQVATRRSARETHWHCLDGVTLTARDAGTWASGAAVEGTALLQDVIEPMGPQKFHLIGRSADLVDVAGKRASLAHLNHQLLSIPAVQDGVFFMPEADGRKVMRLAALAVAPGIRPNDILAALRQLIDPAFLPRPLVLVDNLPRNALGKLPRAALLNLLRTGGKA
jgi:acyl-coenzyme A synthetase/AMP-(fatty) acid ligase